MNHSGLCSLNVSVTVSIARHPSIIIIIIKSIIRIWSLSFSHSVSLSRLLKSPSCPTRQGKQGKQDSSESADTDGKEDADAKEVAEPVRLIFEGREDEEGTKRLKRSRSTKLF